MMLMEFDCHVGRSSERDWLIHEAPRLELNERQEWHASRPSEKPLSSIYAAIDSSRWILDLEENWDEEGAEPYDQETWESAKALLVSYASRALSAHGVEIPAPVISPGPNGSIDLHWTNRDHGFDLLLNVRKKADPAG